MVLFISEPHNIKPGLYNPKEIEKYKGVITWNEKFYNKYKNKLNIKLYNGGQLLDWVLEFKNHRKIHKKINGICAIGKFVKRKPAYDITNQRLKIMKNIEKTGKLITHYYGRKKWGDSNYIGIISGSILGLEKIDVLNKYKFNLCFENCYHEFWSWGYITEKIMCCFEAKTIPIYWGCYNIEKLIPQNLYIDFRKFKNSKDLVDYMLSISDEDYIKMTNEAYKFKLETKINDTNELVKLLGEF